MNAEAHIEGDAILIRLPLENLQAVAEGGWASGALDMRWQITDPAVFAKELCGELNREEEDGTTPIHRLFDRAIDKAAENGAEGIEEHPEQDA